MTEKAQIQTFNSGSVPCITPKTAFELIKEGAVILDLRPSDIAAFKQFDCDMVLYFPARGPAIDPGKLDENKIFILAESSRIDRSKEVFERLHRNGFEYVYFLAGGFIEWERNGFPVKQDINERLSGSCMCQLRPRERKD